MPKTKIKIPSPEIETANFTATNWVSAEDKKKWVFKFCRWIAGGCQFTGFNRTIYTRLNCMFGHIAHYNLLGFADVWINSHDARQRFITNIINHAPIGDPAWTWSDAERIIQNWVKENEAAIRSGL